MILSYLVIRAFFCSMIESCSASWMVILVNVELADRMIDVDFAVGGDVVLIGDCSFRLQVSAEVDGCLVGLGDVVREVFVSKRYVDGVRLCIPA